MVVFHPSPGSFRGKIFPVYVDAEAWIGFIWSCADNLTRFRKLKQAGCLRSLLKLFVDIVIKGILNKCLFLLPKFSAGQVICTRL